mmetsp:Transcript_26623/g.52016  ORF Transcript_26623/g.52016 Transcript_26623/m.52016 type:complete len:241 (+) Transcript_26623:249-971(+)
MGGKICAVRSTPSTAPPTTRLGACTSMYAIPSTAALRTAWSFSSFRASRIRGNLEGIRGSAFGPRLAKICMSLPISPALRYPPCMKAVMVLSTGVNNVRALEGSSFFINSITISTAATRTVFIADSPFGLGCILSISLYWYWACVMPWSRLSVESMTFSSTPSASDAVPNMSINVPMRRTARATVPKLSSCSMMDTDILFILAAAVFSCRFSSMFSGCSFMYSIPILNSDWTQSNTAHDI